MGSQGGPLWAWALGDPVALVDPLALGSPALGDPLALGAHAPHIFNMQIQVFTFLSSQAFEDPNDVFLLHRFFIIFCWVFIQLVIFLLVLLSSMS